MTAPLTMAHGHIPLYHVVRKSWKYPLDASLSQVSRDRRWNTSEFPALYCSCSERMARAIVIDLFEWSASQMADLQPPNLPRLVEIHWAGQVVDMVTAEGISAAGLAASYPDETSKDQTRRLAVEWSSEGREGVVCRSASMARLDFRGWMGAHEEWSELAIFVGNCVREPVLHRTRDDLKWLEQG
jgi:RES domain-containing protein